MNYQRSRASVAQSIYLFKLLPALTMVIGVILSSHVAFANNIVWSDEFNQPDGSSPDPTKWSFEIGNGSSGWGNHELESYTSSLQNAYVSNGVLNIVAYTNSIGGFSFTSARIKSQFLYYTPVYGTLEWRAKLPSGTGMWPALWLLGSNYPTAGWPNCGEIDVVENNGATPTWVQGTLHWSGGSIGGQKYTFPSGDSVTNWHIYDLSWAPSIMRFYVDGHLWETDSGLSAPFNQPFFFIMNLAVGGDYVGDPSVADIKAGTAFPQTMQVDYVRVYEITAPLAISVAPQSDGSFTLSWPTNIVCHLQVQTNSLVGGNWSDLPGTTSPYVVIPDPSQSAVFYRLESP
jgi:beta-glucanase (GH16 family)